MRVLLVHPSALMYSELYLRLEPLGLERVAAAVRAAGHDVRLLDLQIFTHDDYRRELVEFKPEAVGFSLNYLANVPEVIDLAKETRRRAPDCFIMVGGHSGSFIAPELLEHRAGAIDCVVRGEGEVITPRVLEARGDAKLSTLPGVVTQDGQGPAPTLLDDLDRFLPARDLAHKRHKYFIGVLDPCASAELTRGCPWDCSFLSAWTFYGRSYRKSSPAQAAGDRARDRAHRRREHHRRLRLGRAPLRARPRVGHDGAGDRPPDGGHALSRHGDLVHGSAAPDLARLPALRRGPCRAAHAHAPRQI